MGRCNTFFQVPGVEFAVRLPFWCRQPERRLVCLTLMTHLLWFICAFFLLVGSTTCTVVSYLMCSDMLNIPSTRRNDRYVPKESDLTLQNSDTWFYQGRVGYRSLVRTFARFVPPSSSSSSSVFFVFFGFGISSETRSQTHTHTYTNTHTRAREHTRARTRARVRGVSCNIPS